jgi:hypothetical protein
MPNGDGLSNRFFEQVGLEGPDTYEHEPEEIFAYIRDNANKVELEEIQKEVQTHLDNLRDEKKITDPDGKLSTWYVEYLAKRLCKFAKLLEVLEGGYSVWHLAAASEYGDELAKDIRYYSNSEDVDYYGEGFITFDNS